MKSKHWKWNCEFSNKHQHHHHDHVSQQCITILNFFANQIITNVVFYRIYLSILFYTESLCLEFIMEIKSIFIPFIPIKTHEKNRK